VTVADELRTPEAVAVKEAGIVYGATSTSGAVLAYLSAQINQD
jgi:hypothetical protein